MPVNPVIYMPFWMKQRQVKAELVNDSTVRLAAPQLPAYELEVRPTGDDHRWSAAVYEAAPEGGERKLITQYSDSFDSPMTAWEAGYELFRKAVLT
ncbi:MAG: hypothetical protein NZM31_10350 [Gemmatales bacterium]|nr:hypothetical protein [Gemmatales bacterium]MDW8387397.1 hypothetical protein [Gemmatales bacterium]